ncbi:hypothetical protein HDV00_011412 [Rhizophlyctis rosea]|nr:hypothetical protein HDV00_011412 [Rhizophlyctis rosea]
MAAKGMQEGATLGQVFLHEWIAVFFLIFGGCCSNVYTLELLVTEIPKSGNLITLAQFIIVAIEGLFAHLEFGFQPNSILPFRLRKRSIPIKIWLAMVALFWSVSVLNNHALGYRISMPLHIIFRSGSLLVSMVISWAFFGKSFSSQQISGVILVTIGVILSTYSSATSASKSSPGSPHTSLLEWLTGISLLTLALILASFLGQLQQWTYSKYGKHWREGLFYTHALGMPAFLLFWEDLRIQVQAYNASTPMSVTDFAEPLVAPVVSKGVWESVRSGPWEGVVLPKLWMFLILNTVTQYVCISGVHRLSSMATAVTLNLVLSVRKFVSLLVSVFLFHNDFTQGHWVGTAAVFLGTAVYSGMISFGGRGKGGKEMGRKKEE